MDASALLNAARYFCAVQQTVLIEAFDVFQLGYGGLERTCGEAKSNAWPEFVTLRTLLDEIERLDPEAPVSLDEMRQRLLHAVTTAAWRQETSDSLADTLEWEAGHRVTIRRQLAEYIAHLTNGDAAQIPRMPYRRRLDAAERARIFHKLRRRWPSESDDWSLEDAATNVTSALRVESYWLTHEVRQADFTRMLGSVPQRRVWMLRYGTPGGNDSPVWGHNYEVATDYCWPGVRDNVLWAPKRAGWIIVQDRFHGTYFIGEWIVRQIKLVWPTWEQHIWTTMFYDMPPSRPGAFPPPATNGMPACAHGRDDQIVPVWYRPPDWIPSRGTVEGGI